MWYIQSRGETGIIGIDGLVGGGIERKGGASLG